jgi:hypothetical protein
MIEARLKIRATSQRAARSLVECVEPDNTEIRGLNITSRATPNNASFHINCSGRIETFISTLDDLLRCIQAANATLGMIKKKQAS